MFTEYGLQKEIRERQAALERQLARARQMRVPDPGPAPSAVSSGPLAWFRRASRLSAAR